MMRWLGICSVICWLPLAAQVVEYEWPGLGPEPCSQWIGCEEGCSSCNTPVGTDAALLGLAATWSNVDPCPHPSGEGNSMVYTTGWSVAVSDAEIRIDVAAFVPLHVDSIIIDHMGADGGSERLRVGFRASVADSMSVLRDEGIAVAAGHTVITGAGCILAPDGHAFGLARLVLKAYGGGDGWWLDRVRIVASPCLSAGLSVMPYQPASLGRRSIDMLGREVQPGYAPVFRVSAAGGRVMLVE